MTSGAQLDRLALRYGLPAGAADRLRAFTELVAADPLAPTSVRDPRGILQDHVADSLIALELREVSGASEVVDLGAGAGLPGIPLAIALPSTQVTLLESNRRKCEFLERAVDTSAASNAHVVNARAEAWTAGLGRFDLVVVRAVAPLDVVAEYAAPLLRLGGALVAWRGRRDPKAERDAARAAEILGLEVREATPVVPYAGSQHRHLHLMSKVRPTPDRFPRRLGIARKRPLGGATASTAQAEWPS